MLLSPAGAAPLDVASRTSPLHAAMNKAATLMARRALWLFCIGSGASLEWALRATTMGSAWKSWRRGPGPWPAGRSVAARPRASQVEIHDHGVVVGRAPRICHVRVRRVVE